MFDEFVAVVRKKYRAERVQSTTSDLGSACARGGRVSVVGFSLLTALCADRSVCCAAGQFGAMMAVALVNDGPVTLTLDTAGMKFERAVKKESGGKKWEKPSTGSDPTRPTQEPPEGEGEANSSSSSSER